MRLQHYLGGLENLGPVNFFDKKVFMAEWEKRIFGIHTVMMAESTHLDKALPKYPLSQVPTTFKDTWTWASLRTGAESMQPFEYFKYRYYEKWLMGISQFFVDRGYVTAKELATLIEHYRKNPEAPLPERPNHGTQGTDSQVSPSRRLRSARTRCSGSLYRRRHRLCCRSEGRRSHSTAGVFAEQEGHRYRSVPGRVRILCVDGAGWSDRAAACVLRVV